MRFFYGGEITTNDPIKLETLDKILDLLDEYVELVEQIKENNENADSD